MGPNPVQAQQAASINGDSTRVTILERLELLARPPGVDSTLFVPDSLMGLPRTIQTNNPLPEDDFLGKLLTLPEYSIGRRKLFSML